MRKVIKYTRVPVVKCSRCHKRPKQRSINYCKECWAEMARKRRAKLAA